MAHAVHARVVARFGADRPSATDDARTLTATALRGDIRLSVREGLAAIECDWHAFQTQADCTVFQTFDWLATWQRHIGALTGVRPAIVIGRDAVKSAAASHGR